MAMATVRSSLFFAPCVDALKHPLLRSVAILPLLHTMMPVKVETAKWEKITYAGIATCTVLAIYCLSKGHHHEEEPPPYPYLHIRNKEFPWGPDGLFETKKH